MVTSDVDRDHLTPAEVARVEALVRRCGARVACHVLATGPRTLEMARAGRSLTAACARYVRDALARCPR